MADISTELQAINEAVYGKDVRDAIHDAIYKINEVVDPVITKGSATGQSINTTGNTWNSIGDTITAEAGTYLVFGSVSTQASGAFTTRLTFGGSEIPACARGTVAGVPEGNRDVMAANTMAIIKTVASGAFGIQSWSREDKVISGYTLNVVRLG